MVTIFSFQYGLFHCQIWRANKVLLIRRYLEKIAHKIWLRPYGESWIRLLRFSDIRGRSLCVVLGVWADIGTITIEDTDMV